MLEQHVETEMKRSLRELSWGLAGALIATGALTGEVTAAPDSERLELRADPDAWEKRIDGLQGKRGHLNKNDKVELSEVLDKADRHTPDGEACGKDDHPKGGFCWNKGDNLNTEWMPQGLAASWDAPKNESYTGGRTVVAASWYLGKSGDEKAVRVSFSNRDKKTYDFVVPG
jgi:hypothetical protein